MSDAGPLLPSYDDAQAATQASKELKSSFANLKGDHNDIQELFRTVKNQLQNAPEFGDGHLLLEKWETLRSVCSHSFVWLISGLTEGYLLVKRDTSEYTETLNRMRACVLAFSRVSSFRIVTLCELLLRVLASSSRFLGHPHPLVAVV